MRKTRLKGPIGVSKLRTLYGGKQSRGYKSEVFKKGSGSILRKILQQLEKAELLKQDKKGVHKGRVITPVGIKLIDNVAKRMMGSKVAKIKIPKKKEEDEPKPNRAATGSASPI